MQKYYNVLLNKYNFQGEIKCDISYWTESKYSVRKHLDL